MSNASKLLMKYKKSNERYHTDRCKCNHLRKDHYGSSPVACIHALYTVIECKCEKYEPNFETMMLDII